jgi:uncharacterized protein (DUF2141 family)
MNAQVRRLFLLGVILPTLVSSHARADPGCTLTVHVSVLRSQSGALVCRLFASGEGFPGKPTYKTAQRVPIRGKEASCAFRGASPGTYAVAVFHDENGNGKLDTNFLGIPSEGVGVSNNKRPLVGPPSWDDARFRLEHDGSIRVMLHY